MDPNSYVLFIICCALGLVSFILFLYFAIIEAAFASCRPTQETFEKLKEIERQRVRDNLLWLINRPQMVQRAIFLLQTIVCLLLAFSISLLLIIYHHTAVTIGICAVITILAAFIITVAMQSATMASHFSVLKRSARFTKGLVRIIIPLLRDSRQPSTAANSDTFSIEGLEQALEMQNTKEEKDILNGVLHFGEETVGEIMTPRLDVVAVDLHDSFEDVMDCIVKNNFSRVPVTDEMQDRVKGVLYAKDLLPFRNEKPDFNWQQLIRQAFFVPESKMIDDLLREFQRSKVHIAVVVDEYGSFSGIVTMEDILEEIVGEINDEFDEEEKTYIQLDDTHFIFEGKTPIADFFEIIHMKEEDFQDEIGEAETLAGFVLELMNEFPQKHQKTSCRQLSFEVLALDKRRISKIKVTITPPQNAEDEK